MTRELVVPKDEEIRQEGVEAIIRSLGIAKAAFFFRRTIAQKTDYLKLKDELFGDLSVSDLYREIKNR